jgi:hypothetical protein
MADTIKIKRATNAQLLAAAAANQLKEGEPYLITDTGNIAVGTSLNTYREFENNLISSDFDKVAQLYTNCCTALANSFAPYVGAAISAGTIAAGNAASITGDRPFAVKLRCATTANAGYRIVTDPTIKFTKPSFFSTWIKIDTITNSTFRFGFHNSTTVADAADGCYFEITNNGTTTTASGKIANNSVRANTVGAIPTFSTGATDWYKLEILVTPDPVFTPNSTAVFTIRNASKTQIFTETLTGSLIPTTRLTASGVIATNTILTATDLVHIHNIKTRISNLNR